MKRFIIGAVIGFILGVFAMFIFVYCGGAVYVKTLAGKTDVAAERLEEFEKGIKDVDESTEAVKEKAGSAKDRVKELLD
ncbi:MAG TPA: hypothetical protein VJM57_03520 [Thermodesulfobacteriota bacterium]|nr:hypothetical protein [Thermodesulfobacteriota bacterium]